MKFTSKVARKIRGDATEHVVAMRAEMAEFERRQQQELQRIQQQLDNLQQEIAVDYEAVVEAMTFVSQTLRRLQTEAGIAVQNSDALSK